MSNKAQGFAWEARIPRDLKLILVCMSDHADHDGEGIFPAIDKIAWKTGADRRTVQRAIKKMLDLGYLEITGQKRSGTNVYRMVYENLPMEEGRQNATGGVAKCRGGGGKMPPDPSVNNNNNNIYIERPSNAVTVYLENGGRFTSGTLADGTTKEEKAIKVITNTVKDNPESLEFWGKVVKRYTSQWRPESYTTMLKEYYLKGKLPINKNTAEVISPKAKTILDTLAPHYPKHPNGNPAIDYDKEFSAANQIAIEGYTPEQVVETYKEMRKDPFWTGKAITLSSIAKRLPYSIKNQRNPELTGLW